ncbi:MAG: dihydroneopterin aldolase [Candidatus Eremiobacteraeota bacterium]|nr:dihydroneopterin aldolase [Candidatus Eremiobacteraeota bacterium]
MDVIEIRGIVAEGRHGANPGERDRPQPFEIDVTLEVDLTAAERTDELDRTVDYAAVHASIVAIVADRSYALLERLAGEIIRDLFGDTRIAGAHVRIGKPALLNGATPFVTLRRRNQAFTQ